MTLFKVYHWYSNKTGWVLSGYRRATSYKALLREHSEYKNKWEWLIVGIGVK